MVVLLVDLEFENGSPETRIILLCHLSTSLFSTRKAKDCQHFFFSIGVRLDFEIVFAIGVSFDFEVGLKHTLSCGCFISLWAATLTVSPNLSTGGRGLVGAQAVKEHTI